MAFDDFPLFADSKAVDFVTGLFAADKSFGAGALGRHTVRMHPPFCREKRFPWYRLLLAN